MKNEEIIQRFKFEMEIGLFKIVKTKTLLGLNNIIDTEFMLFKFDEEKLMKMACIFEELGFTYEYRIGRKYIEVNLTDKFVSNFFYLREEDSTVINSIPDYVSHYNPSLAEILWFDSLKTGRNLND